MKILFKNLNWKFGTLVSLMILGIVLVEQSLLMNQARVAMESRLAEKAAFINTFYAFLIADSLQRKDDVTLLQVINRLEEDPEILSVVVLDGTGEVRYHADSQKLGTHWDDPQMAKVLQSGDSDMHPFQNAAGRGLMLISPLKAQGMPHPIGAVQIDMTYRHVQDQLGKFQSSFQLALLAFICAGIGLITATVRWWVTIPLEQAEKVLTGLHLATADPILPEPPDEFGRLNKAINDMIIRFRMELQEQLASGLQPAEFEKEMAERLLQSFLPAASLLIANKENRLMTYRRNGQNVLKDQPHLLDVITDDRFASLVGAAFQKEGELQRGEVQFEEQNQLAAVLCLPDSLSKVVHTLIVLTPTQEKGAA